MVEIYKEDQRMAISTIEKLRQQYNSELEKIKLTNKNLVNKLQTLENNM